MRKLIKRVLFFLFTKYRDRVVAHFTDEFAIAIKRHPELGEPAEGEDAWLKKWQAYGKGVSLNTYRVSSHEVAPDINILPFSICRNVVEPVLTPEQYHSFYSDKNSFGLLFDKNDMPRTYFRCMNGVFFDGDYKGVKASDMLNCIGDATEIFVKPTNLQGGKGAAIYKKENGKFVNTKGEDLNVETLLKEYKANFIIQERFSQSEFMAQFNPTSVNTIRMTAYRNPQTGETRVLRAFVRMGGKGAFVDNTHSGGMYAGIDDNGKLLPFVINNFGDRKSIHNDIDFEHTTFVIPNYEAVKAFAIRLTRRMPHMHLFAFDIAIDVNGLPKLIEVNTSSFDPALSHMTLGPTFREYTDEIVEYCAKQKDKLDIDIVRSYNH